MKPLSASHRRAADATSVLSTVTRSKVERLMTLSTSAVAVCCCSDSLRSVVRWRSSFSSRVFLQISYMYGLLVANGPPHNRCAVELHRLPAPQVAANFADGGPDPHHAVFDDNNVNKLRLADAGGMFGNRLENRCYVARRARDHGQDIADRGLLLQCLAQLARAGLYLVEQPYILDRDHSLVGKCFCQLDLFFRERLLRVTGDYQDSDGRSLAQQRNAKYRAFANCLEAGGVNIGIGEDIREVKRPPFEQDSAAYCCAARLE